MSINATSNSSCSSTSYTIESENKNLSRIISKHYNVMFQNVAKIEDAQVILLGDLHDDVYHRVLNSTLIELLYQPQDIILVETPPIYCSFSQQIAGFLSGVNINGWDHPNRITEDDFFQKQFHQLISLAENIRENDWLNWVGDVLKLYPQNREMEEAYYLQQIEMDFGHYTKKEQPMIAKALISSIAIEWVDYIISYIDDTFIQRNLHMVNQINDLYFTDRKVFVIAGKGHLFEDKKSTQIHIDAIEKLHHGLSGKKFIILNPKKPSVKPVSTLDRFKRTWQKGNWKDRTKAIAKELGLAAVSLVAIPILGVGSIINKLKPFSPSDLKHGDLQIPDLIEKYIVLGIQYYEFSYLMQIEAHVSAKYNQTISEENRKIRNSLKKEVDEELSK